MSGFNDLGIHLLSSEAWFMKLKHNSCKQSFHSQVGCVKSWLSHRTQEHSPVAYQTHCKPI